MLAIPRRFTDQHMFIMLCLCICFVAFVFCCIWKVSLDCLHVACISTRRLKADPYTQSCKQHCIISLSLLAAPPAFNATHVFAQILWSYPDRRYHWTGNQRHWHGEHDIYNFVAWCQLRHSLWRSRIEKLLRFSWRCRWTWCYGLQDDSGFCCNLCTLMFMCALLAESYN